MFIKYIYSRICLIKCAHSTLKGLYVEPVTCLLFLHICNCLKKSKLIIQQQNKMMVIQAVPLNFLKKCENISNENFREYERRKRGEQK